MKKFTTELSDAQGVAYHHITTHLSKDGSNFKDVYLGLAEGSSSVPAFVAESYRQLTPVEQLEVLHFATKKALRKHRS